MGNGGEEETREAKREAGRRVQARENRGARYRVTNSPTPEIHPFIGAHQVRGCIQERNRGLLLGSLFYLIVVSHGVLETEPTRCATGIHGGKKGRGGEKKKKEKRKGRVHRNVGKTETKFGAERRRERETRKQGKARESGEKKDRKRRERKRNGENVKRRTRKKK